MSTHSIHRAPAHLARSLLLGCALIGSALIGCASTPAPRELVDARAAYQRASQSQAAALTPDQLYNARKALDRAERAFLDAPETHRTRDLAYIAQRKAMQAESLGNTALARKQILEAQQNFERTATGELKRARKDLAHETAARTEADRRSQDAMDALAKLASTRRETRGLVITLSGGVLFASGKSELLGTAETKLGEVVTAIKSSGRTILVEGHTDSRGGHEYNMNLSRQRAEAVVAYMVTSGGLPQASVRAAGLGPDRPIADNGSAEGRANNRRVEIILQEQM
jgi:outer membrane protein OmpA-like peptidoglycan-associated protein